MLSPRSSALASLWDYLLCPDPKYKILGNSKISSLHTNPCLVQESTQAGSILTWVRGLSWDLGVKIWATWWGATGGMVLTFFVLLHQRRGWGNGSSAQTCRNKAREEALRVATLLTAPTTLPGNIQETQSSGLKGGNSKTQTDKMLFRSGCPRDQKATRHSTEELC